jgi:hypothetical protein
MEPAKNGLGNDGLREVGNRRRVRRDISMTELHKCTATKLAAMIRAGEVSSREVVEAESSPVLTRRSPLPVTSSTTVSE